MGTKSSAGQGILIPSAPARITRADFPSPPELQDRDPALAPGEHVGGVRIELRLRDGQVQLARTYQQNPLRILRPVAEYPEGPALLYLLNSTAGLLDGDGQWVDLDAGPGVRCFLTNQSAGRVHPCPLSHAAARYDLRLAPGAVLCALPGPTIPFAGSRYHQRATIDLAEGASIIWGDILLPGRTRYARSPERFAFHRIVQELRIRRVGRLVYHERFAWSGPWDEDEIRWHLDRAEAVASLFVSGPLAADLVPELAEGELAVQATAFGDTYIRLIGRDPESLIAATARLALSAAARQAGDPCPWFLDSNRLAATHWFSPPPCS